MFHLIVYIHMFHRILKMFLFLLKLYHLYSFDIFDHMVHLLLDFSFLILVLNQYQPLQLLLLVHQLHHNLIGAYVFRQWQPQEIGGWMADAGQPLQQLGGQGLPGLGVVAFLLFEQGDGAVVEARVMSREALPILIVIGLASDACLVDRQVRHMRSLKGDPATIVVLGSGLYLWLRKGVQAASPSAHAADKSAGVFAGGALPASGAARSTEGAL